MIFYICIVLAFLVTVSGIIVCSRGLNLFGRLESPVHAVLAISLINTCILYLPWFLYSWQTDIGDVKHNLLIIPFMIVRLMQTVSMDADYESAIEIAHLAQVSGVSESFLQFYSVVLSYVSVMVPLSGILSIAGIFGNGIGYRLATGRLSRRVRVYVFNGVGDRNMELAQSIYEYEGKNARRCSFLFCNVRETPGDTAKRQIKKFKGWYTAEHPSMLLRTVTYRRKRTIDFFLLEDDECNFNDSMGILRAAESLKRGRKKRRKQDSGGEQAGGSQKRSRRGGGDQSGNGSQNHWKDADRVKVHLLLESDQLDNILDAQEKFGIFVRIMNTESMCVQELFMMWPLFSGLSEEQKTISLMIIGNGSIAEKALHSALWMGQLATASLKIYYVGEDADDIRNRMYMTCPALFDPSFAGGVSYHLEFESLTNKEELRLHEREFPDTNYIVISCGDDEENVRTAMWVRTWLARQKPENTQQPFIAVCIRDSRHARRADGLCIQESRESYDFHVFGTDSRLFTADNILRSKLDQILFNVQLSYTMNDADTVPTAEEKDEAWMQLNKSVYNFRSSEASAQYIVSRLFDAGAIEESMRREFEDTEGGAAGAAGAVPVGAGDVAPNTAGALRKYSGIKQAKYFMDAVLAGELDGDRTQIDRIISIYEEMIKDPEVLDLLAQTEHRRWITYMAVNGWIPMPVEELRNRMRAHTGGHKDYLRLRHAAMVSWEGLDEISDIITDGKDRDKFKNSDRTVVRSVRKYLV